MAHSFLWHTEISGKKCKSFFFVYVYLHGIQMGWKGLKRLFKDFVYFTPRVIWNEFGTSHFLYDLQHMLISLQLINLRRVNRKQKLNMQINRRF